MEVDVAVAASDFKMGAAKPARIKLNTAKS
jgi:hypothetical protein